MIVNINFSRNKLKTHKIIMDMKCIFNKMKMNITIKVNMLIIIISTIWKISMSGLKNMFNNITIIMIRY